MRAIVSEPAVEFGRVSGRYAGAIADASDRGRSVVDAVLIDPLPFPNVDRLVSIRASAPGTDMPAEFGVGTEFFVQYEEQADMLWKL